MRFVKNEDALYESGKYEEAIKCYDKAIEMDPNNSHALCMKGASLNYLGKYNEAIECADKVIECADKVIEIDYVDALALKGEAFGYKGKYNEAKECAEKALKIDEESGYAWFVKGYATDYSGHHDEALEYFEKARKDDCADVYVEALIATGIALNYKNSYDDAEKYFNKAILQGENICRYQDTAYAYLNKSVSLYNLKKDKEEVDRCLNEAKKTQIRPYQ